MSQSPLFVKTYDLLHWLIPLTLQLPRQQRGVLTRRIQVVEFENDLEFELRRAVISRCVT